MYSEGGLTPLEGHCIGNDGQCVTMEQGELSSQVRAVMRLTL